MQRILADVVRIAGYWLLYALVGTLVILMLVAGGGDLGSEDSKSPIHKNTKIIGALNGLAIGTSLFGLYLTRHATASKSIATALFYGGAACAVILGVWTWLRIARDLRRKKSR